MSPRRGPGFKRRCGRSACAAQAGSTSGLLHQSFPMLEHLPGTSLFNSLKVSLKSSLCMPCSAVRVLGRYCTMPYGAGSALLCPSSPALPKGPSTYLGSAASRQEAAGPEAPREQPASWLLCRHTAGFLLPSLPAPQRSEPEQGGRRHSWLTFPPPSGF